MSVKILFISMITGNKFAGPSYSVPATIKHMTKYADISWLNLDDRYSFNQDEFPKVNFASNCVFSHIEGECIFKKLGKPDIVVFEDLYNIHFCKIAKYLRRNRIPYIIVPRGGLCKAAQKKKRMKKFMGNFLFFNSFIRGAAAIHYLTENERVDSGNHWNYNTFVIPNGVTIPEIPTKIITSKDIQGTFIGRLDIYHKGIDLLLGAIANKRNELIEKSIKIRIYGADLIGDTSRINSYIQEKSLNDIVELYGPVYDSDKDLVLRETSFFILTSRFEGHPTGLLEALSYGIPALVTDGSNMGSEIKAWNAGWVSNNNIEGVSESIDKLLSDVESLPEIGRNARILALEYSWDAICKKISLELHKVMNQK